MNNLAYFEDHPRKPNPQEEKLEPEVLSRILSELGAMARSAPVSDVQVFPIRNFRSDNYRLKGELVVVLEEQDGQYVASSYDTNQYGYGDSPDEAITHLCSAIETYYEILLEDEGRLTPALDTNLRYLRSELEALT
jgi:predicted RNase H-like HicB family nuclease